MGHEKEQLTLSGVRELLGGARCQRAMDGHWEVSVLICTGRLSEMDTSATTAAVLRGLHRASCDWRVHCLVDTGVTEGRQAR